MSAKKTSRKCLLGLKSRPFDLLFALRRFRPIVTAIFNNSLRRGIKLTYLILILNNVARRVKSNTLTKNFKVWN